MQNLFHFSFSKLLGVPEMCYFLHFVLGVDLDKDALASPLVKGRLRRANLMKPARNQAAPLGVRDVRALESFLANKEHHCVDRFVVGAFLFAVYARARLGDLKSISAVTLDFRRKGDGTVQSGYLELKSYSHKARSARSARGYDLPLVAPIQGVGQALWGVHFVEAAVEANRDLENLEDKSPLVVQPSVVGGWTSKPLSNDRFVKWVLEALDTSGHVCANKVTGHSAKCTTLSWLSKAGASVETRTVLGHHALPGFRSAETYSRDLISAPLRELDRVLDDVRLGHFMPAQARTVRYAQHLRASWRRRARLSR